MPPTLVHAALAGLLGAGVLGRRLTPRSAAVVAVAGALPDLDAVLSPLWVGTHGAVLHNVFVPLGAAAALYYDTHHRERSIVEARWGTYGVAVGWTAVVVYVVAGIGLDLFNVDAAAVLWPIDRRFYLVVGRAAYSTQGGFVQTFVEFQAGWPPVLVESFGTGRFVATPLDTAPGPDPADAARVLQVVESGWQLLLLAAAAVGVSVAVRGEH
jgi:hypothetical protein